MTHFEILHNGGIYTNHIAEILGMTEDEVNDQRDTYEKELDRLAAERVEPDVRADFSDALPEEEARDFRMKYLKNEYNGAKKEFQNACKEYAKLLHLDSRLGYWHVKHIQEVEDYMHKTLREVRLLMGKEENISPLTIAKAREYPIADILKVNKAGMASCPFHTDKKPSMDTRRNFFHCYSCGETGDVIDLVMKLEHMNFVQAITRLT